MVYTDKNKLTTNITIEIINMINPNMVMALKMLFLVFFLVVTVLTTCFCDTNNIATAVKIIGNERIYPKIKHSMYSGIAKSRQIITCNFAKSLNII